MAPIRPILALKEANGHRSPYSSHYLADAIKAKYTEKIKENESTWKEMISVGQLIALFIEGKQILDWNPYAQAYTPRKLKTHRPEQDQGSKLHAGLLHDVAGQVGFVKP
jgi:hypothetical protein